MIPVQQNDDKIKEKVGWSSADKFYELLQELQMDMLECRKQSDVYGMIDTLGDIYIHVWPYIETLMKPEEEKLLDNCDDIADKLNGQKDNMTDFATRKNNMIIRDCLNKINGRRKILSKLMAKAELTLPLNQLKIRKYAALSRDGI